MQWSQVQVGSLPMPGRDDGIHIIAGLGHGSHSKPQIS